MLEYKDRNLQVVDQQFSKVYEPPRVLTNVQIWI